MNGAANTLLEDVLDAFAVEPRHDRETLERYIREYPQFASELIDLSRELNRLVVENESPPSDKDRALMEKAWNESIQPIAPDPFTKLTISEFR